MAQFSEDDQGKAVVMGGEKVGIVERVEGGKAYVDPDPNLTDRVKATLDWGDMGEDSYPLQKDRVDTITDDEVRLRTEM